MINSKSEKYTITVYL